MSFEGLKNIFGGQKEDKKPIYQKDSVLEIRVQKIPEDHEIKQETLQIGRDVIKSGDNVGVAGRDGVMSFSYVYQGISPDGEVVVFNQKTKQRELHKRKTFENWQYSEEAVYERKKQRP